MASESDFAIAWINAVVAIRKHCAVSCHPFYPNPITEKYCKNYCPLYKYRIGKSPNYKSYEVAYTILIELIENHCYRWCGHEHCNNCSLRKYKEAYGK